MGVVRLMNYKPGDKVKIKTWEEMKEEFGVFTSQKININDHLCCFNRTMDEVINKLQTNRVLTIKEIIEEKKEVPQKQLKICEHYIMKEMVWNKKQEENTGDKEKYRWTDNMIEASVEEPIPILSRFDLLDL